METGAENRKQNSIPIQQPNTKVKRWYGNKLCFYKAGK